MRAEEAEERELQQKEEEEGGAAAAADAGAAMDAEGAGGGGAVTRAPRPRPAAEAARSARDRRELMYEQLRSFLRRFGEQGAAAASGVAVALGLGGSMEVDEGGEAGTRSTPRFREEVRAMLRLGLLDIDAGAGADR